MSIDFSCKSYGKWILAGEHAVLRGVPALVFPLRSRQLELNYTSADHSLDVVLVGDHGKDLQLLVWGVLEKACEKVNINKEMLKGTLKLESSIPVGAGMGASAALCVALTRWLGHLGFVSSEDYYEFSRDLENLFHGESSGVDIAVALSGEGLRFVRAGEKKSLNPNWSPRWYISYSGVRGVTLDAVNKVKSLLQKDAELGAALDQKMAVAVEMAEASLMMGPEEGLPALAKSMGLAAECFEQWGLSDGAPGEHIQWLKEHGALAVKPTGSGGGGYVLSLWKEEPPVEVLTSLISC